MRSVTFGRHVEALAQRRVRPFDATSEGSVDVIAYLDDASLQIEGRRGWLFVTDSLIRSRAAGAILLYSRANDQAS